MSRRTRNAGLPVSETHSGIISRIVAGGDGLLRTGGGVIFVPFSIPGEHVSVSAVRGGKDFLRGTVDEIFEPSSDRAAPPCPLFTKCGGCNFQHMTYRRQLSVKQDIVCDAFARIGKMPMERPPIVPSHELYYRNRVQIHGRPDGTLGFMRRDSNDVLEVKHCYIAHPSINTLFNSPPASLPGRFTVFAWGDSLRIGDRDGGNMTVTVSGRNITFDPNGFFQSNIAMLDELIPAFLTAVRRVERRTFSVVDLYAGAGLFGSFLADYFEKVVSVEQHPAGIRYARQNIAGFSHEFHALDVDEWVRLQNPTPSESIPDLVVADPPRTGLSERVREYLVKSPLRTFIYISCNPVTLARDASLLQAGGFLLKELTLFDFYPQTSHIESLAFFEKN